MGESGQGEEADVTQRMSKEQGSHLTVSHRADWAGLAVGRAAVRLGHWVHGVSPSRLLVAPSSREHGPARVGGCSLFYFSGLLTLKLKVGGPGNQETPAV